MPDTGILCILLLARFFGLPADGAQLRHQFGQSGKPLDDADLLRAAKSLDLKAGIVRTDMAHLAGTPLPAIAKRHDGRYVIIAKVEGENVLVHDPHEQRPTILTKTDFKAAWSGQLLLATKRAHLRPHDLTFDFTWFIPAVVKYRRLLGEVVAASFFLQLFGLLTPLFTQIVIDKVLVHKGFTTLHVLAVGMVALGSVRCPVEWAPERTSLRIRRIGLMSALARNSSAMSWRCLWRILKRDESAIPWRAFANLSISASS